MGGRQPAYQEPEMRYMSGGQPADEFLARWMDWACNTSFVSYDPNTLMVRLLARFRPGKLAVVGGPEQEQK
jgi:hypothetical protein